jgi:uncharacterized protein
MARMAKKPSKAASPKKRRSARPRAAAGERRLIGLAVAVIAVAAASIGAMLALQFRNAEPVPATVHAEAAVPAPTAAKAVSPQKLPLYEEPVEPAALAPRQQAAPAPVTAPQGPSAQAAGKPAWERFAVLSGAPAHDDRPQIAVVIDDLGVDRERAARTIRLPGPLTMAWLPYAHDLAQQTGAARRAGHELLVHVPMDPQDRTVTDPGPNALLVGLAPDELQRRLVWNLSQFDSYVGINNHMGSRFTADAQSLAPVMAELKRRGLLFLDSRTSARSAAVPAAHLQGVPVVARDVFIDHDAAAEAVHAALAQVEQVARRNGHAVAIGHPRDTTIEALAAWLPLLEKRGFRLVPLSALVREQYPSG